MATLDDGLRVVTEAMPSVRSVALGLWIATGSRFESDEQAGLSHLIEHLLFKGSARYSSLQIDQIFDAMGAELNAGTGKETTSVYARMIDQHLPEAFDVMVDMVFAPTFQEIDAEREVILEEIAMYEDDPQEKVFDVFGAAVFGSDPLGRAIIGRAEVIAQTPSEEIARFHASRYLPENVVIAAAGAVDHDELVRLASERMNDLSLSGAHRAAPARTVPPVEPACRRRFERKDTEQYHVCLGGPGISRHDDRRFALRVLDTLFGGTSSSRLFQEVRERRGLAYSVYSFASAYQDTGQVGLYLGTRAENLGEAMAVVGQELGRLREDPGSAEEVQRAKENLKGRVVLALESTGARMNRLGSEVLAGEPLLSIDEVVECIEAVTRQDLAALVEELWAPERLTAASIGPDEGRFQEALAGVSPSAVEA
ncbi:MAG TPA: pitrilysin family protein [Solirubrobacteraceae bacterium]|nr:pitrilysin family protein [Solirubrobacteraceae bacterium]